MCPALSANLPNHSRSLVKLAKGGGRCDKWKAPKPNAASTRVASVAQMESTHYAAPAIERSLRPCCEATRLYPTAIRPHPKGVAHAALFWFGDNLPTQSGGGHFAHFTVFTVSSVNTK